MSLTRRQTLGWAAIGATLPLLAWGVDAASGKSILAVHSFIWLQQMRSRKKPLAESLDDVFGTVAAAGFKNMELMSFFLEPDVRETTGRISASRIRLNCCARLELAYADETKPTRSLEEDLRLSRVYAQKVFGLVAEANQSGGRRRKAYTERREYYR